jgi:hypothetical protein
MSFHSRILAVAGISVAAGAALIAGDIGSASASPAPVATSHVAPSARHVATPADCVDWVIVADGLRIHNAPSTSATVVGLGYDGDTVALYGSVSGWDNIRDSRTGVVGWVASQYVVNEATCTQ